jgi:DnaK suppressor protein
MKKELQDIYDKLAGLKKEILKRNSICEDVDVDGDEIDLIQGMSIIETNKKILQNDIDLLKKIDVALLKFQDGRYGICEMCEEEISVKRLNIVPYTDLCILCKEAMEKESKNHR